jgi:hypothetical protein
MSTANEASEQAIPGPLLANAFFCEQTIEEADKTLSVIRIVDTITITLPANTPEDFPSEEKRVGVLIRALVSFRRGGAPAKGHRLKLVMRSPDGNTGVIHDDVFDFGEGPTAALNMRPEVTIAVKKGGLFWMDVTLDEKEFTRVPLTITIEREANKDGALPQGGATSAAT